MVTILNAFIDFLNRCGEMHWQFASQMFLQVCVLVVVLMVLDLLLLRRLRASVRYGIWSLVLLKLMLPVSLSSPVSVSRLVPHMSTVRMFDGSQSRQISVPSELERATVPQAPSEQARYQPSQSVVDEGRLASVASAAEHVKQTHFNSPKSMEPIGRQASTERLASVGWKTFALFGWLLMVIALLIQFVRRALLIRRLVYRSVAADEDARLLLKSCHRETRVANTNVRLRVSGDVGSPAICGLRTATILVPPKLSEKLSHDQLRQILVHELTHWQRFDLHVNLIQTLLQIIYFYNPFVWLANAVIRRLREHAVDDVVLETLQSPPQAYSSTLIAIAESSRPALLLPLRMVGVLESHKALSSRIKRILDRPTPRQARLGVTGIAAVALVGLFLLPMAAHDRSVRADQAPTSEAPVTEVDDEFPEPFVSLAGRIADGTGKPVADAQIMIFTPSRGEGIERRTDANGRYQFENLQEEGTYRVTIKAEGWVGISHRDRRRINLTLSERIERDFTLERACRLRIRVIDEQGKAIAGAKLMAKLLSDDRHTAPEAVRSNAEGWATLGLKSSDIDYIVAIWHDGYGYEKLIAKLDDPAKASNHQIVLRRGVPIPGTAICSDGQPPAGWRIRALPNWWHFGRYPNGVVIADDGSFILPHIVSGEYDVTISVPSGEGSIPREVLSKVNLFQTDGLLRVKMDHPSPASLVFITGKVKIEGDAPQDGFWVFANSLDRQTHSSTYMRGDGREFRIGPVPKGIYQLRAEDVGLECEEIRVAAPSDDVELVIKVAGKPELVGKVTDGQTNQPITDFRIRVMKLRTLSGPNYVEDPSWREFKSKTGTFKTTVNGPGVYQVLVSAEGFATTRSKRLNTVEQRGRPTHVELSKGVSLRGTVLDEQGRSIDGAMVIPLSSAVGSMPRVAGRFASEDGAVETTDGLFELKNLLPGKETLRVTHPDYCFTIVSEVSVGSESDEPLKITLTRGGTVRGHVFDAQGNPEPNVTLVFQDDYAYGGGPDQEAGRFAKVVTDADGYYEVHHLPEQLCHVSRTDEWKSLGVVRHAIQPSNGRAHTLNIGGDTTLKGRLTINGNPFTDGRVLISGENPTFGIFKAYGMTASDGSFVFHGIPAGKRTLYYALAGRRNDWGRVRDVLVPSKSIDLGEINQLTGRIVVRVVTPAGDDTSEVRLSLHQYNPIWAHGNRVGAVKRLDHEEPFVIEQIPSGKYELVCYRSGGLQVQQFVEITKDSLRQVKVVRIPKGTATLGGKLAKEFGAGLRIWSTDGQLLGYIRAKEDGTYRLEGIPAGDYVVRDKDTRTAPVLTSFSIRDHEHKTLDFTPDKFPPSGSNDGYLVVRAYTAAGVPVPCDIYLEGPNGRVTPNSSQNGRVAFVGAIGPYTLLLDHPGFRSVRKQVELRPLDDGPREGRKNQVTIQVEEL